MRDAMSEQSGPFGWMSPAVACLTKANPEFWTVAVGMDRAALHLLGLLLSHMKTGNWETRDWRAFAHALQFAKRRDLVRVYAPLVPLGAVNLTHKLKDPLWRASTYRALA